MVQDGDRVLVCLSGGKDSLSLLHTLRQYQHIARAKGVGFSLGAVTVDPGSASYNPRPLIPYLAALRVPYFFEEQGIIYALLHPHIPPLSPYIHHSSPLTPHPSPPLPLLQVFSRRLCPWETSAPQSAASAPE